MTHMIRSALAAVTAVICLSTAFAEEPDGDDIWPKLRQGLFGDRVVEEGDEARLKLDLPTRAFDAGIVPLGIRYQALPGDAGLRKLYLVIDQNPSPVGAIFEFGPPRSGIEFETRVRVEDYTWVRVIAERADGSLVSTRRFIKASGGCSAPAGKTIAERMEGIGKIKWRMDGGTVPDARRAVQLIIRHPNISGLAMDQLTRLYDPAVFVNHVRVTQDDSLVFSAQIDFTISENPAFRFTLPPGGGDDLHAEVTDTDGRVFESTYRITGHD